MEPAGIPLGTLKHTHGAAPLACSVSADKTREPMPESLPNCFPAIGSHAECGLEFPWQAVDHIGVKTNPRDAQKVARSGFARQPSDPSQRDSPGAHTGE